MHDVAIYDLYLYLHLHILCMYSFSIRKELWQDAQSVLAMHKFLISNLSFEIEIQLNSLQNLLYLICHENETKDKDHVSRVIRMKTLLDVLERK